VKREILIIRNVPRENPGLIETGLKEHNLNYEIIDFDHTTITRPLKEYGALIVLGGPESANDSSQKMIGESELIRKAVMAGIPYLGICLGLQIFVKALGGKVLKCTTGETGFRDPEGKLYEINLTTEGRHDRLFKNLPDSLNVFQLHGETVEITPQMTLLGTGKYCQNQIVRYKEKAYGIQCHFELTNDLLDSWITEDPDLLKLDPDQLRVDFEALKPEYQKTGRQLFNNFLDIAGLS
jgi:GMP synthase-like glutamine amidotransferase